MARMARMSSPHDQASMTDPRMPSAARANRAIGAMFFSAFGTAWLAWGDVTARGGRDGTLVAIIIAGVALFAAAWRRFQANRSARAAVADTPRARRVRRVFHAVDAGQWVLIFVLANVLDSAGLGQWVVPMVIAIVGAHFLPLAAVMGYRPHYASGLALLALAAVYPFVAAAGPLSAAGPLGAGLILWASAAWALRAGARTGRTDEHGITDIAAGSAPSSRT